MRAPLYLMGVLMVVFTAFWSYRMTYATQDRYAAIAELRREIGRERQAIAVLRADWAYLNAPERLETLVAAHGAALGLGPMTPEHFAMAGEIAMPAADDGMAPVAIIDLDDLAPRLTAAPRPAPRPVRAGAR